MKTAQLLAGLFLALLCLSLNAQTTTGFNYQAVLRNAAYQPIANQSGTATVAILDAGGAELYKEVHLNVNTDPLGLFNLVIGSGQTLSGNFAAIDWGSGERRLKITVSTGGNTYDFDPSTLQAVPYAKLAERALAGDADANPTNELQTLSLSGNQLTLSAGGGTVSLPQPAANALHDADNDTRILVEKNPDEDVVRVDLGGTEYMVLRKNSGGTPRLELRDSNLNTYVGSQSGKANTSGQSNTAIGQEALASNTTGYSNVAAGVGALFSNTTGYSNVAVGGATLYSNTAGYGNTAMGTLALSSNSDGHSNTATGEDAMRNNTTGTSNTATGSDALYSNTSGYFNTATGVNTLYSNTTGYNNVAVGYEALFKNTTGSTNVALGGGALRSTTTGGGNTAIGAGSLRGNTTGFDNIAVGALAMNTQPSRNNNLAVGIGAMKNSTGGAYNLALGSSALETNTTGRENIAIGYNALLANTEGSWNIALGSSSLLKSKTSNFNIGIGFGSLISNTNGNRNVAIGTECQNANTSGLQNTAVGDGALFVNDNGNYNTAVGANALQGVGGGNNTAVGYRAGNADYTSFYAAAFGSEAANTSSDQIMLGDPPIGAIGGYKNWTNFSDGRFKKNVKENVPGLDFVMRLRPVTYTLDIAGIKSYTNSPQPDSTDLRALELYQARVRRAESEITTGFIAQEVEQAALSAGYDFSGIDKPNGKCDPYGLRYGDFTAPLVKAIQEQQALLEQKDSAINALLRQVETLEARLTQLEMALSAGNKR